MKKWGILLMVFYSCLFIIYSCEGNSSTDNMKDMGQNMMDLRIYQENLGDEINSGKLQDAEWLLEGMDSILRLVSVQFHEHRKLRRSFSYYYDKSLKEPIDDIRGAIHQNDSATARKAYRVLVKECNGCHIDHDIEKEVRF